MTEQQTEEERAERERRNEMRGRGQQWKRKQECERQKRAFRPEEEIGQIQAKVVYFSQRRVSGSSHHGDVSTNSLQWGAMRS